MVLHNGLLVPEDRLLIVEYQLEPILIPQNHFFLREDPLLIPECRWCHCPDLAGGVMSGAARPSPECTTAPAGVPGSLTVSISLRQERSNLTQAMDVMQGTLALLILKALSLEPMHGWVTSHWRTTENNRIARYYELTGAGRQARGRTSRVTIPKTVQYHRVFIHELSDEPGDRVIPRGQPRSSPWNGRVDER